MSTKMLDQLLDSTGNSIVVSGGIIVDRATGKSMSDLAAAAADLITSEQAAALVGAAVGALKDNGDGSTLPDEYDSLLKLSAALGAVKATLEVFLKGEEDGGNIDRLTELVSAIGNNKDSIDALVADVLRDGDVVADLTSTDDAKVLAASQGKALKDLIDALSAVSHSHANSATLAGISVAASGNLSFNGRELTGAGLAVVADAGDTPDYDSKLVLVVTDYTPA